MVFATSLLITLCTLLERLSRRDQFRWSHRWPGVLFGLLVPVFGLMVSYPLRQLWHLLGVELVIVLPIAPLGIVGAFVAILLVQDFFSYWEHRFEHRFLWPVHAVHHSPRHLSAANSYSHPLQFVSIFFLHAVPMSLIDFGPHAPYGLAITIISLLALWIHSPVRWGFGPLRRLLVDPAYHRIHHSLEERHFDRNFSVLFSFWDRLFGTQWMPDPEEWPDTGVHAVRPPRTLSELFVLPFRLWRADAQEAHSTLPRASAAANRPSGLGV
jgi:sterol desaturase/sphingolipid hydroxylase (fatty acid hydroxylase superfamily)